MFRYVYDIYVNVYNIKSTLFVSCDIKYSWLYYNKNWLTLQATFMASC